MLKLILGFMIALLMSKEALCWNPLKQGPLFFALNVVVLLGLIGFLVFIKRKERSDE